ncbi:MAG: hypothetical protein NVSMB46_05440 [Candidatus Saccharimonadales bacterium]
MTEAATQSEFVYAFHTDEYAESIGHTLLSANTKPDIVAIEWASIGNNTDEVKRRIPLVHNLFNRIIDPKSSVETTQLALQSLGSFYGELLKPLVGSAVEISLIDTYEDPNIGVKSAHYSYIEQPKRLTNIVANDRMSMEDRKEDILLLAKEGSIIYGVREEVVVEQLRQLARRASHLAVYQGVGHQAVATALFHEGWQTNKHFIPSLKAWREEKIVDVDYTPAFIKLIESLTVKDEYNDEINTLVEKALLTEFVIAHIAKNPRLAAEVGNVYGAMVAATRIVENLDPEKLAQKLKAVVKASRTHSPSARVIAPLMPKHSLNVFVD